MKPFALVIAISAFTALSIAEPSSQVDRSSQSTQLLGGRLTVNLPSIMHGPAVEMRIIAPVVEFGKTEWNDGRGRMRLVSYELFERAGDDFGRIVRKQIDALSTKMVVGEIKLTSPLRGYLYYPVEPETQKSMNFVMGLYVVSGDGTVQRLAISADHAAEHDFVNARAVAASVFATVAPGKARINISAGERTFFHQPSGSAISITVPDGYVAIGSSFVGVRKLVSFGEQEMMIVLQTGNDPPVQSFGFTKGAETSLFGKATQWYEGSIKSVSGRTHLQAAAAVSLPFDTGSTIMIVRLQAPDAAGIEELKKSSSTLRWVEPTFKSR